MQASLLRHLSATAVSLALALAASHAAALADDGDPGVARLSVLRGAVDVKRADSGDTFAASVNAPVSAGDYVTTGAGARAEIQYPFGTSLRVASDTQLRFTRLDRDDHVAQLAAGTVELRLFRGLQAHPEVATPAATVRPTEDGRYRITVDNDGDSAITVRSGRADVITQTGTRTLTAGNGLVVTGTGDATQLQPQGEPAYDDFDRWNGERDAYVESARDFGYVDQGIVGADDLDRYGEWQDSGYGRAWHPNVEAGWAPYNDGRWTWQPYYGWTWVAAEPWGWAPYHYGRWFYASNGWCWSPGVVASWPVVYSAPVVFATPVFYQPALVAFFSFGSGFGGFGFGNIGWVPLAPREPFHRWWGAGIANRTTIDNVTTINNITNVTNVNNYYANAPGTGTVKKMYRNAAAPGGAVGVRADNFAAGRFDHVVALRAGDLPTVSPVRGVLPVVPTAKNLAYSDRAPTAAGAGVESRFTAFAAPKFTTRSFPEQQAEMKRLTLKSYPASAPAFERPATTARKPSVPATPATTPRTPAAALSTPVERIEGSTIETAPAYAAGRHAASPWDRFEGPTRAAHPEPASHAFAAQSSHSGTTARSGGAGTFGEVRSVPTHTSDPFSRFGEDGYARSAAASHQSLAHSRTVTGATSPTRATSHSSAGDPYRSSPMREPYRSGPSGEPSYHSSRPQSVESRGPQASQDRASRESVTTTRTQERTQSPERTH